MWQILTLVWNRSGSTQGQNLKNLGSTCIDNAIYQVSRSSVYLFWRRRFLRFLPYMGMGPCWSCDPNHLYKFSFPLFSHKLPHELWFQITQLFLRKASFNFEIWVIFDQGQRLTLTFDTHSTSLTHLAECFNQLWDLRLHSFQKIIIFTFSHTETYVTKFDLGVK